MKDLLALRREYGNRALEENALQSDPLSQFKIWLEEAFTAKLLDPNAMVLSTVDENNHPDSRVVLLKDMDTGLIFFTDCSSKKAAQIEKNNHVALNFNWLELARQVRIRGTIERTTREIAEQYFSTRPRESQLATLSSSQSKIISRREELETKFKALETQYQNQPLSCPETWGGYRVIPTEVEFFQGRDHRLSDRIRYTLSKQHWKIERLSP